jgi:hypothetical protein
LVEYGEALIVAYLGVLVAGLVLHHLGVVALEPVTATVLAVVNATCLGAVVFWLVKTFREIGRELGVLCFGKDRCIALDDIALIYIEPGERRDNKVQK